MRETMPDVVGDSDVLVVSGDNMDRVASLRVDLPEEPAGDQVDCDENVYDGDAMCTCSCGGIQEMDIYSVGFLLERTEYVAVSDYYDHFENYRSRPRFRTEHSPEPSPLLSPSVMTVPLAKPTSTAEDALPKRKLIIPDIEATPVDFLRENHDTSGGIEEENEIDLRKYSTAGGDDVSTDVHYRSKTSPYADVVSLTLDEIALIRGALAKAELENLEEQDARLFDDIRRSKVCFSCRRVRFSQFIWMFREGGVKCHLCQNTICTACSRQMVLPCDRLDRIPVHTLSPALDDDDVASPEPTPRQSLTQLRPISSASTMPRQRQFQRSQTLEFTSSTLPKTQIRQRPPLQRGLTITNSARHQETSWPPPVQRRKISLPSEAPSFIIQVCVECHSVLYHAILESHSQATSVTSSRAVSSQLQVRDTSGHGISYHTSTSSVISDSQSDSLDEDFCDMSDFVDDVQAQSQQRSTLRVMRCGDQSVSPANSRSDSTSSEAGAFYSNHI